MLITYNAIIAVIWFALGCFSAWSDKLDAEVTIMYFSLAICHVLLLVAMVLQRDINKAMEQKGREDT